MLRAFGPWRWPCQFGATAIVHTYTGPIVGKSPSENCRGPRQTRPPHCHRQILTPASLIGLLPNIIRVVDNIYAQHERRLCAKGHVSPEFGKVAGLPIVTAPQDNCFMEKESPEWEETK